MKGALTASGLSPETVPNPFVVPIARVSGRTILFDAGTGGQLGPTTGMMLDNMKGAGIDLGSVDLILISHFHPDHIFGLMAKDINAPVFAKVTHPWGPLGLGVNIDQPRAARKELRDFCDARGKVSIRLDASIVTAHRR